MDQHDRKNGRPEILGDGCLDLGCVPARRERTVIVHARYRNKEQEPDPNVKDVFFEQDSFRFGGRLRYGRPDLNFNAECLYSIENRPSGREDNRTFRYGIGAEYNIAKNVWINLNTGSQSGNDGGNNLFVLGNLNFAFSPEPTMTFK
jgi:hypothetical protein